MHLRQLVHPPRRLRLEAKRDLLAHELAARGWTELPRKTRFLVRLPEATDVAGAALPLLQRIRQSRPDARLTVIGPAALASEARLSGAADQYEPLPARARERLRLAARLRREFPDACFVLAEDAGADREAWVAGAPQRFGIQRETRRRHRLTEVHGTVAAAPTSLAAWTAEWLAFFRAFGLREDEATKPVEPVSGSGQGGVDHG